MWKFFISVKLTIVLLLSLAATSAIGTIVPQNKNPQAYFQAYGEFFYRIFNFLDLFDMYHSWWFQLLLMLLTINIIMCSIDRLSSTGKIIFAKNPKVRPDRFRKRHDNKNFTDKRSAQALETDYEAELKKHFGAIKKENTEKGFYIYAEKWRLSKLGVYIVHLSVVLLLVGGLIGSFFGFEGFVNIAEGETVNSIRLMKSNAIRKLDFAIRCDDFDVSFYKNGAPKEFRSTLVLLENGSEVKRKDIIVNDPLRYKGINMFQSSYGQVPNSTPEKKQNQPVDIEKGFELVFLSKSSGMTYTNDTKIGEVVKVPEGLGKFMVTEHLPNADFRGMSLGSALRGILTPTEGEPFEVLLPLKFPNFDKMRGGNIVISVHFHEKRSHNQPVKEEIKYYTGLQVTRDPGVWVVYTGFILMIAGCFVTFYMSHQQVFVEVVQLKKNSRVTISGRSDKNRLAMKSKLEKLENSLNGLSTNDKEQLKQ